jgi:cysteine synthase
MPIVVPGPTYEEMRDPHNLPARWWQRASEAVNDDRSPANLFDISWRRPDGSLLAISLTRSLTGVDANVIVLLGATFPSGSHKVGTAYATLAEAEALDGVRPGSKTAIGPSTGNFGISTAYVSS